MESHVQFRKSSARPRHVATACLDWLVHDLESLSNVDDPEGNTHDSMPGFSPRGLVGGYATFPDNQYQYPMQQYGYGSLPPQNSHYNMLPPPGRPLTGDVTSQSYHPDTTMRKVSTLSSTNEDETNETDLQEMKLTDSTK